MPLLPTISSSELARFTRGFFGKIVILALIAVPSLYGGLLIWTNLHAQTQLDGVPAAIVNLDEPATVTDANGKKQTVPLGRVVAGKLEGSDETSNLNWNITDEERARKGLDDGTYYAVLTIPAGFSRAATSTSDANSARQASMSLRTNDATSYLAGNIAAAIGSKVAASAGHELTQTYLDRLYLGFNGISEQMGKAGQGARDLAAGTGKLANGVEQSADGAGKLTVGLTELAKGTGMLRGGMAQAADGAGKLSDGAGALAGGASTLSDGLGTMRDKTAALPGQATRLADGAAKIGPGAMALADGANKLAAGLEAGRAKAAALPAGVTKLQRGADQLAAGAAKLGPGAELYAAGAKKYADGAQTYASSTKEFAAGAQKLSAGVGQAVGKLGPAVAAAGDLADGAKKAADGTATYTTAVSGLARQCRASGASAEYCAKLNAVAGEGPAVAAGTAKVASGADRLADGLKSAGSGTAELQAAVARLSAGADGLSAGATALGAGATELSQNAGRLAAGAAALAPGAKELAAGLGLLAQQAPAIVDGYGQAAAGARTLAAGATMFASKTGQLAAGLNALAAGVPQLANGIAAAAAGAEQLTSGAVKLHSGAGLLSGKLAQAAGGVGKLDDGANSARDGAKKLADGSAKLADGAGKADDGATKLADGLTTGAKKVPTFNDTQREKLGTVVAEPIGADATRLHKVAAYGEGLAPYFIALGLWVGGMAIFFVLRPLPRRAVASTATSWRVALAGLAPAAVLGVVQALVLTGICRFWIGMEVARPWLFLVFAILASVTFVAINQAFIAALGTKGRFLALLLIVLQLSAAGATYPIETSPGFFQAIHPWLPLTYAVRAFRSLIAGGALHLDSSALVLVAWLAGSIVLTIYTARRQRRWSMERLRPDLAM